MSGKRSAPDPEDVDARFAELIEGNFGERVKTRPAPTDLLAAWDAAERIVSPDEGKPEPLPPMARWSMLASLGTAMTLMGTILGLLAWLGLGLAPWVSWFAVIAAVGGLAILLIAALRRKGNPDITDDGTRV